MRIDMLVIGTTIPMVGFLSNIDIKDLVYILNLEYESDLPNVWAFMD